VSLSVLIPYQAHRIKRFITVDSETEVTREGAQSYRSINHDDL
jgi:hypothetical protein